LFIHTALNADSEMQCEETVSHMTTTRRSLFRTSAKRVRPPPWLHAKTFASLKCSSWPHRTSNHMINVCFCLLTTCRKRPYFIEESIWPGVQRLGFEVKYEYFRAPVTNISCTGGSPMGKPLNTVWEVLMGTQRFDPSPW